LKKTKFFRGFPSFAHEGLRYEIQLTEAIVHTPVGIEVSIPYIQTFVLRWDVRDKPEMTIVFMVDSSYCSGLISCHEGAGKCESSISRRVTTLLSYLVLAAAGLRDEARDV
jgi:hypothetical protein